MANNNDNSKFYSVEFLTNLNRKRKYEKYQVNGKTINVVDTIATKDSTCDIVAGTLISVPLKCFEPSVGTYFFKENPEDIYIRVLKRDVKVTPPGGGVQLTSMATMPEVNGTPSETLSETRNRVRTRWEEAYRRDFPDGKQSSKQIYEIIKRAIKARLSASLRASTSAFWQEADMLKPEFGEVIAKPAPAPEPAPAPAVPEPVSAPEPAATTPVPAVPEPVSEPTLTAPAAPTMNTNIEEAVGMVEKVIQNNIRKYAELVIAAHYNDGFGDMDTAEIDDIMFSIADKHKAIASIIEKLMEPAPREYSPAPAAPPAPAPEPKPVAPKPAPTSSKKRNLKDIKADVMSAGHRQLPSKSDPELRKLIQKFVVEHSAGHKNLNQFSDKSYYSRTTFWSRAEELLNDGKQLTDTPAEPTAPAAPVTPATAPAAKQSWKEMKSQLSEDFQAFNPKLNQTKINALIKKQMAALGIEPRGNARNADYWMDVFQAINSNGVDIATLAVTGKVAKVAAA